MKKKKSTKPLSRLSDFRPQRQNANTHTERGIGRLDVSIRERGYMTPMTAAADGEIFDGSARLEKSADIFGAEIEPIIVRSRGDRPIVHIREDIGSADDPRAVQLALEANRIAQLNLNYDPALLAQIAQGVGSDLIPKLFTPKELVAIGVEAGRKAIAEKDAGRAFDNGAELQKKWRIKTGQIWKLGSHALACGDCTNKDLVAQLLKGNKIGAVVTDPPYGIELQSASKLKSKAGGWNDAMNNSAVYSAWYQNWINLIGDGLVWVFINWQTLPVLMKAVSDIGYTHESVMIWDKEWIGPGGHRGLRPSYEMVTLLCAGAGRVENRGAPDIARFQWSSVKPTGHQAEKPLGLMAHLIGLSQGNIFDPFCGSGTTIIAAESLGRIAFGIEISPVFCAIALERFQHATGATPELIK